MELTVQHIEGGCRNGSGIADPRAEFEHLMAGSWTRAMSMARRLTQNHADADDLMQDTCVKAWRGFAAFRPDRPFINWVLRIMHHAFVDHKRLGNPIRHAESLHGMLGPTGEVHELVIVDPSPTPLERVLAADVYNDIQRALSVLPREYRSAVVLCDVMGLSYADIALSSGTSIGTVRSRIHRGRQLVRYALTEAPQSARRGWSTHSRLPIASSHGQARGDLRT